MRMSLYGTEAQVGGVPLTDLARGGSAVASDALGLKASLAFDIRPVTCAVEFCGPATTVAVDPGDNRAAYEALAVVRPGDVLVISAAGNLDVAMVGGTLAGHCRNLGVVAIVTDGLVRDRPALDRLGIPVWARGMTPNAPTKLTVGEVGGAVRIGGLQISAGDVLIGDLDGVALVPKAPPQAFAETFRRMLEREAQLELGVGRGDAEPSWLSALKERERK